MKKAILLTVLMVFGLALFSGCASMQRWPDSERSAENKMVVIQEKIGDGLKTNALTPDDPEGYSNRLYGAERQRGLPGRMGQASWKA